MSTIVTVQLQQQNRRQHDWLQKLEEVNKRQRAASEQRQGRLRELEEQLRITIENQQRAMGAGSEQLQQWQLTDGMRTAYGVETKLQQGAGMLGGDNHQLSTLHAEMQTKSPTTASTSSSHCGGGNAHTGAVTRPRRRLQHPSLDNDTKLEVGSVSLEVAENSCQEREEGTDAGGGNSGGSDACDSTYIDSDSGERAQAGSTCDESSAGDGGSGAGSGAAATPGTPAPLAVTISNR
ncbi:hypothetical protein JKP88DRAFT_248362 [Tribonema minus]|uniref:Uncharacterized protein n=1 Tax=Tribonema minus TaxID=303371 RepID=A0A835YMQ4_9STRA|nr:hypothetical protein JKP88DRAFT_248362 [Tribonema minus]